MCEPQEVILIYCTILAEEMFSRGLTASFCVYNTNVIKSCKTVFQGSFAFPNIASFNKQENSDLHFSHLSFCLINVYVWFHSVYSMLLLKKKKRKINIQKKRFYLQSWSCTDDVCRQKRFCSWIFWKMKQTNKYDSCIALKNKIGSTLKGLRFIIASFSPFSFLSLSLIET